MQLISSMANNARVEHMLRGHKATLYFGRTVFVIRPESIYNDESKEIAHTKSGTEAVDLHHLMNAIRACEPLKCDWMTGVATQLGVLSYRRRQYLRWDAARERIVRA